MHVFMKMYMCSVDETCEEENGTKAGLSIPKKE